MKIGFIGLGIMGSGMAKNLLNAGCDLAVFNRSKEKATSFLDGGAAWLDSPEKFAELDIVFTMLAHPEAIESVALGADGFLPKLKPNALWVDCSTVHPSFSRQLHHTAQEHGVRFLEAPVAGTKPQAEAGTLAFFVGGSAEDVAICEPYFQMMGQKVIHVGSAGMGTSLKLVINYMLATAMATFAEGVSLGKALGISQEVLLNSLIGGPVTAPFLQSKKEKMATAEYSPQFPLQWMHKDLHMVTLAAYESGTPMPIGEATKALYGSALQAGMGMLDLTAVYHFLNGKKEK